MATWEQDQKFKRDTIAEIDREHGRANERERIVAIINRQREWHVNTPYNNPESTGRVQIAIGYAIEVLDSILAEIQNG